MTPQQMQMMQAQQMMQMQMMQQQQSMGMQGGMMGGMQGGMMMGGMQGGMMQGGMQGGMMMGGMQGGMMMGGGGGGGGFQRNDPPRYVGAQSLHSGHPGTMPAHMGFMEAKTSPSLVAGRQGPRRRGDEAVPVVPVKPPPKVHPKIDVISFKEAKESPTLVKPVL